MADGVRFELTNSVKSRRFSRPVHSTALPPIRVNRHNAIFSIKNQEIILKNKNQIKSICCRDVLMLFRKISGTFFNLEDSMKKCHYKKNRNKQGG